MFGYGKQRKEFT